MSKDQVQFIMCVNGTRAAELGKVFVEAFGEPMPAKGVARPDRSWDREFVTVTCRPSQFARFLILRNLAGLQNNFRDLEPKLLRPTPPAPPTAKIDVTSNPA